jgi:MFS family permease
VTTRPDVPTATARWLLALASLAVCFAAADTYVVVLALPEMMGSAGVPIDQLQRAAPIISGFLLGYVAMLPLIGRIADLRGRVPVLVVSLVLFAVGSLVTTLAYDMPSMVAGRFAQGVGGGGLVPATLALVADLYPPERRGVPLGVVSAVQELGAVLGPLFGAVVLAVADWRAIFAINLAVGLVLAAAIAALGRRSGPPRRRRADPLGLLLVLALTATTALTMLQPPALMRDLTWGRLFVPWLDGSRWATPAGALTVAVALALLARLWWAREPLFDLRSWVRSLRDADLAGAALLALALGGVILAFATADPKVQVFSPGGLWFLLGGAVAAVALGWHLRRTAAPLLPGGALARTPAWGALVVSFFVGAALIAALIDIPLFARTTVHPDSQLSAALVLVRFLLALPVGAVVGGFLIRRFAPGPVTAVGMLMAAAGFVLMTRWGLTTLEEPVANVALLLGGFGFGLALAPVNAALLAFTDDAVHGVASAFVVVARMVGMLVGISALTTLGLRRFYAAREAVPPVQEVCDGQSRCAEFSELLRVAGIAQEHAVFWGAAGCAVVAAVAALVLFRSAGPARLSTGDLLRGGA